MRPSLLDPLFAPLTRLPGIGPRLGALFDRLLGREPARVLDLVLHLPTGVVERPFYASLAEAPPDAIVTVEVTVAEHRGPPRNRARAPWRVLTEDTSGDLTLVFFHGFGGHLEKTLPVGARRLVSGRIEIFDGMRQMVHPDYVLPPARRSELPAVEPVYPLTEGLTQRRVAQAAGEALLRLKPLPEWRRPLLPEAAPGGFVEAIRALHAPDRPEALAPQGPAMLRLAGDELLAGQIGLLLARRRLKARAGRATVASGRLVAAARAALPFSLTAAQDRAVAAIHADMAQPERMLRLLQGDVGSGKTLVALMAMLQAAEAGRQAAMMAPTDILAQQHFERLGPLAREAGAEMALLTGRTRTAERAATLDGLASGRIPLVLGTHALFQGDVRFADLGLAVVDEQHRFGVQQRLSLQEKGAAADLLVMTATPIPRTLALTLFGDMDVSVLDEKPPGRLPVETRVIAVERMEELVAALGRAMAAGQRIYWVCPLVAESEAGDDAAAEARFADLSRRFPGRVGLVHGRLPGPEKDAAVAAFARGDTALLVATTVIEVGVDVPSATIIVIEEAQRFGLAQLHQLRGRVGRGGGVSRCFLLYRGPLSPTAEARLRILRETEDGFRIAEEDLRLRGPGDIVGTQQAGALAFRFARLPEHEPLLRLAREEARQALDEDPELAGPRQDLRLLLHLFGREDAIRLLQAG